MMTTEILDDLRYAVRTLARSPGFACIAIITLALGIGANSAVFSFVDALLLKTLPVNEPERLVVLGPGGMGTMSTADAPQEDHFSFAQFEAIRQRSEVFAAVSASPTVSTTVLIGDRVPGDDPERAACELVSGEFFSMMGIRPLAGRWIEPNDDEVSTAARVVVISHSYWQRRLGGDPEPLGRTLVLQDMPFQVIGIAPPTFRGHRLELPADMWAPLSFQPTLTRQPSYLSGEHRTSRYWLNVLARLAPGATIEQAEVVVNGEIRRIHEAGSNAELRDFHVSVMPAGAGLSSLRGSLSQPLLLLYGATGLLLLIACANLANLMLARAADRRREVGVRLALGASRWRLARQLLGESAVLALLGTGLGLAVASWLMPVMRGMIAEMRVPSMLQVQLDLRVVLLTSLIGLATVILFGAAPVMWSLRTSLRTALSGGRGASLSSFRQARTTNILLAAQIGLSLVLLSSTGLLLRTLGELREVDLGIETDSVVLFAIDARRAGMPVAGQDAMRHSLVEGVRAIPGVMAVAFASSPPMSGNSGTSTTEIEGYEPGPDENMNLIHDVASDGYFDTFGIPLVEGRFFDPSDRFREVCIVSESLARRFFGERSAVGKTLRGRYEPMRIVGVVGDVRHVSLRDEPPPIVYKPANSYDDYLRTLMIRLQGGGAAIGQSVQTVVRSVVPQVPFNGTARTVTGLVDSAMKVETLLSWLTGVFAAVALALAALGVFGVFSYSVKQRAGEFGVRQALGANRGNLIRLVVGQASVVLMVGSVFGVAGSMYAARLLEGTLYGVSSLDSIALGGALILQVAVGLLAVYDPARRAAAVNPAELLRQE